MRRLIPILTGKEDNHEFLEEAVRDADELILLHVVKREDIGDVPAGYAGSKIKKGEEVMEKIVEKISPRMKVESNMEWGDPTKKIMALATINDVDEVVLKKSKTADDIEEELKEMRINVKII